MFKSWWAVEARQEKVANQTTEKFGATRELGAEQLFDRARPHREIGTPKVRKPSSRQLHESLRRRLTSDNMPPKKKVERGAQENIQVRIYNSEKSS